MRTSLLSTTVIATCFAASAFAADLPSRTAPVAPVVYVPAFTWTGFYIGLNAGGAWAGSRDVTVTGPGGGPANAVIGGSGDGAFVGGLQAGYNWQSGAFVYGVEADIQYVSMSNNVAWGRLHVVERHQQ